MTCVVHTDDGDDTDDDATTSAINRNPALLQSVQATFDLPAETAVGINSEFAGALGVARLVSDDEIRSSISHSPTAARL